MTRTTYTYSIREKVWIWPGVAGWHFVTLPKKLSAEIKNGGTRKRVGFVPIQATLGATTWRTSLFPHTSEGTYLLAVKAQVRKKESVLVGDVISISLCII